MKNLSVALLVFNEKDNLNNTVIKAYEVLTNISDSFELWVFDNNSDDGSYEILEKLKNKFEFLHVYRQKSNIGYAQNFYSALKIPKTKFKFVIDGDGQYDISDVEPAIEKLKKDTAIIVGIRKPRKDPIIRILMSFFLGILSRLILNSKLKDINCGFRGMTEEAEKLINISYNYNFVGPEVFILSIKNNLNLSEIKIKHYKRLGGKSYFTGFFKTISSCLLMIKYLFQLRKLIKKN
tara:strand:+ start:407 stop:1114 length:708 start_codon:yes stop_codon:yes gene_type:complete